MTFPQLSVSQEMISLKKLKNLRLGVYLIPSTAVLAHRAYHVQNQPEPAHIQWHQALIDLGIADARQPPNPALLISLYHQKPEPNFGPNSCILCHDAFFNQSKNAEQNASAVMKENIPSLETVEWMDWFSPSHLGASSYTVSSLTEARVH